MASELKSNDTKKPLVRFSRVITASKESMSGRPALYALWPVSDRATLPTAGHSVDCRGLDEGDLRSDLRRGRRPAPSADRVPVVHEVQLAGLLAALGHGPDREDAAVDAHVADLGLVQDAARAR